eukprot:CAMPEP_0185399800 /NCGR_PEP_ID=MMETSP1364-20130426/90470_1 /TAXON_ID=38817 /ORGANISM="Gephyrocapsa oceanica, Strain RCC1303" /LENGTH=512 /DNA_ID=CAMNT_0028002085 /DNA_START=366 /DNA_END=1907 /DNA_ORIENTATION=-
MPRGPPNETDEAIAILKQQVSEGRVLEKVHGAVPIEVKIQSGKVIKLGVYKAPPNRRRPMFPECPSVVVRNISTAGRVTGVSKAEARRRRSVTGKALVQRQKKNVKAGRAKSFQKRDGSHGGTGGNSHGGLKQTTKDSPLIKGVIAAGQALVNGEAPTEQQLYAQTAEALVDKGVIAAGQALVNGEAPTEQQLYAQTAEALVEASVRLPDGVSETFEQVEARAKRLSGKAPKALEELEYLLRRQPGQLDLLHDTEGRITLASPAKNITEYAVAAVGFSGSAPAFKAVANATAAKKTSGEKTYLLPSKLTESVRSLHEAAAKVAAGQAAGGLVSCARAATAELRTKPPSSDMRVRDAQDYLVYKYVAGKLGLKPLEDLNVLRVLYLVFGRTMTGHRVPGSDRKDGIELNMETLMYVLRPATRSQNSPLSIWYIFGAVFKHHALSDYLVFGRTMCGHRVPGSDKKDGIELNMETLMYIFGAVFKHHALSDCLDQTKVWHAILGALRARWGVGTR